MDQLKLRKQVSQRLDLRFYSILRISSDLQNIHEKHDMG